MMNDPRFDALLKGREISEENMRNHLIGGLVHGLAIADTDMAAKFVIDLAAAGNERATGLLSIVTGLGLGATPVAIANMNAITSKYGPSFKAFLIVPLVGAFFIDLVNAMVIKFFIGLPMMQGPM